MPRQATLVSLVALVAVGALGCRRAVPPGPATASDGGTPDPPLITGPVPFRSFATPAAALRFILRDERPRIVGLGEFHQRTGAAAATSAVQRFGDQMLEVLGGRASDLIVETWMTEGSCGQVEQKVVSHVQKTIERPPETEDEVLALLKRAKGLGIQPHILKLSCADYRKLLAQKSVDYERLLTLIMTQLRDTARQVLAARDRLALARDGGAPETRLIALYGGALHNDLAPAAGLEGYSYAAALTEAARGRYVEVDLYVPELVRGDESLRKERWYPLLGRAGPDRTLLIERGPRSYIVILPTTPRVAAKPAPRDAGTDAGGGRL